MGDASIQVATMMNTYNAGKDTESVSNLEYWKVLQRPDEGQLEPE